MGAPPPSTSVHARPAPLLLVVRWPTIVPGRDCIFTFTFRNAKWALPEIPGEKICHSPGSVSSMASPGDREPLKINNLQIGIHLALQKLAMNKKLLIVEDDEALRKILQLLLENSYDTTVAMNGKQGLEMATSQRPDLILMDIMMPEMDGLEVLRRLKEDPKMARIPVILLTAKGGDENIYGGYQLGADYYIPKPFTNAQLLNGINMFLGPEKAAAGS